MVSPRPIPEAAKGAPVIATSDKIKLSILNKPDIIFDQRISGYVVIDPWFYALLIEKYNEGKK